MTFQLVNQNPRILALSHKGVVRPLELAFPYAIDKLQADEGHRDGEKPVVVDDVPLEVQLLNPLQSQTHRGSQGLLSLSCSLATGFGPTCLQPGWQ